jgi:Protein of unknown function (DUF2877)
VTSIRPVDVFAGEFAGAASTLLADLLVVPGLRLREVARTASSVHYDTGHAEVPVLCVANREAVRLPHTFVTDTLPTAPELVDASWRVTRWWHPARPVGLGPPGPERLAALGGTTYDALDPEALDPDALVGRGDGLTPEGDDVLAAALVTAHATGDPRLESWRAATRAALVRRRTTAVSRGIVHHALDGYATPELAELLVVVCRGGELTGPVTRLRALGHTSGAALLDGVAYTLASRPGVPHHEGAA